MGATDWEEVKDDDWQEVADWTEVPEPVPDVYEGAKAFAASAGDAAALGYGPHLMAAMQSFFDPNRDYVSYRDENISGLKELSSRNPYASTAGTVAGAIGSSLAGGAALKGASMLAKAPQLARVGQAASAGGRIRNAAGTGAALGFAYNPGDTEGERSGLQLEDRAFNAGLGLVTGAGTQYGLEKLGNLPENLKQSARERALKVIGVGKKKLQNDPGFYMTGKRSELKDLADAMYDEGVIKPFWAAKDVAEELIDKTDEIGAKIGSSVNRLDTFVPKGSAEKLAGRAKRNIEEAAYTTPDWAKAKKSLGRFLDDEIVPLEEVGYKDVWNLRRGLGKEINWDKRMGAGPAMADAKKTLYNTYKNEVLEGARQAGDDNLSNLMRRYSTLEGAEELATGEAARLLSNRYWSPSDYATGMMGTLATPAADTLEGGVKKGLIGLAAGAANKFARERLPSAMGYLANQGAKAAARSRFLVPGAKAVAEQFSPQAVSTVYNLIDEPEFRKNYLQRISNIGSSESQNWAQQSALRSNQESAVKAYLDN